MEPKMQKAFKAMEELEKGAIANPDEKRMVGHYWLRSPHLAPNRVLKDQIEKTLHRICEFAEAIITAKVFNVFLVLSTISWSNPVGLYLY
jgi:glucose-6-phosphate isomerase